MARRKPDLNNALAYIGIAVSYALLLAFVLTPIAQPCGDRITASLRIGLIAALFILLFFVAITGRKKAFWLAPQLLVVCAFALPNEIVTLRDPASICFTGD